MEEARRVARQRIRVRFVKTGGARFISHLDLMRAFERAVRRAGIPLAYSAGFNPRPQISFASALALGASSEAEYADFELYRRMPVRDFARRLNAELPPDLRLHEAGEVPVAAPPLMAVINLASFEVRFDVAVKDGEGTVRREAGGRQNGDYAAVLQRGVEELLAREDIPVRREGKKSRLVDLRPLIVELRLAEVRDGTVLLEMVLRTGSGGGARPEEVVSALIRQCGLVPGPSPVRVHRRGLFWERQGRVGTPWESPPSGA